MCHLIVRGLRPLLSSVSHYWTNSGTRKADERRSSRSLRFLIGTSRLLGHRSTILSLFKQVSATQQCWWINQANTFKILTYNTRICRSWISSGDMRNKVCLVEKSLFNSHGGTDGLWRVSDGMSGFCLSFPNLFAISIHLQSLPSAREHKHSFEWIHNGSFSGWLARGRRCARERVSAPAGNASDGHGLLCLIYLRLTMS